MKLDAKGTTVMSMLEFEEYKGKLNALKPTLDDLQEALHLEEAKREIAELQEESAQEKSQKKKRPQQEKKGTRNR